MKKLLLLSLIIPFLIACEQVDTGFRGVKTVWGEVDEKAGSLPEGMYTYNVITSSILEMDTRVKRYDGKANTYTKDVQQADIGYAINYHLAKDKAHIVYRDIGKGWENVVIIPVVEGNLKKVIGQYEAVALIEHRSKATEVARKLIAEELASKNVVLTNFEMVNIQYLKEFEKSVEDKVIATQKAAEAVNNTKRIQEEARQTIINAQALAESMRIRANALTQNKALIEYEAVQAWKAGGSKVPDTLIIGGNGAIPLLNLGGK
jgi:regulator of protease activity HflC (stomatin/prohibitin superfamily)